MRLDSVAWCGMVWYGTVWHGMPWHGMAWYGMAWHGMVWHGMVWHGMVGVMVPARTTGAHPTWLIRSSIPVGPVSRRIIPSVPSCHNGDIALIRVKIK